MRRAQNSKNYHENSLEQRRKNGKGRQQTFRKSTLSKSAMSAMMEALSSEEAKKRWEFLLWVENLKPRKAISSSPKSSKAGKRKRPLSSFSSSKKAVSSNATGPVGDPYDCSSIAVLPTHDIVENTIHGFLQQWKNLDDRKIYKKPTTSKLPPGTATREDGKDPLTGSTITVDSDTKSYRNTNYGGGWKQMEDRLSLPDGFDYNAKSSDQQWIENESLADDDLVISLTNPAERLSYRRELAKLFDSIPTYRELEEQARCGHEVHNTFKVYQESRDATKTPPGCFQLARVRARERHGLPQSLTSSLHSNTDGSKRRKNRLQSATVLLEFWRKQQKRSTLSGRTVMEFLASQTLWDVHVALLHLAEDDLWDGAHGGNNKISTEDASTTESCDGNEKKKFDDKGDSGNNMSGCFFIENTFYQTGSVDYAKPITAWIDGKKSNDFHSIRRGYLGLNPSDVIKHVKTMKGTKLSQVAFRPNIRYYHACHGDMETTVMLVDRIFSCQKKDNKECQRFPLIHDISSAPRLHGMPLCDACQIYQSVFKTSINCKTTDGGPRSLCQECCKDLNLLENEQDSVKLYRQWHAQTNL